MGVTGRGIEGAWAALKTRAQNTRTYLGSLLIKEVNLVAGNLQVRLCSPN